MTSATQAFVGKAYLSVGNGASPEVFTRYCEVDSISAVGEKNSLVDVTTFCSGGVMEYIPGLSDGSEITFGANLTLTAGTDKTTQEGLRTDVGNKAIRHFTLQFGDASPLEMTLHFAMAMISYEFAPSVNKQNAIKFVGKITGAITTS